MGLSHTTSSPGTKWSQKCLVLRISVIVKLHMADVGVSDSVLQLVEGYHDENR